MRSWKRWVIAGAVAAAAAGLWSERRAAACFLGTCDALIVANQVTQIGQMVTQLSHMVSQLGSLDGILDTANRSLGMTQELVESDSPTMGNIGRMRETVDRLRELELQGIGLSTAGTVVGAFNQRIPGVTDQAGWLEVLANAETALVSGAFGSWAVPNERAREVLQSMQLMAAGARSYQELWGDLEEDGPAVLTEADIREVTADAEAQERMVEWHEQAEATAATRLVHAHAEAEAASAMAALVDEVSRILEETRGDDLMRLQRLEQAGLTVGVIETELGLAQAQLAAYQGARETWERYAAEAARREARAQWQTDRLLARQMQEQYAAELEDVANAFDDGHRYFPSTAGW